jgi:hypothetical protein
MFALAEEGHRTLFEQLVACILSIRTRDEVSLVAARRAHLPPHRWARGRHDFPPRQGREIAPATDRLHRGGLPCDAELVRSFRGVGPKCAHPRAGNRVCGATDQRGHPRPPGDQPLGIGARPDASADDGTLDRGPPWDSASSKTRNRHIPDELHDVTDGRGPASSPPSPRSSVVPGRKIPTPAGIFLAYCVGWLAAVARRAQLHGSRRLGPV